MSERGERAVEPKLPELLEATRALYVGLSEYRIGPMVDASEVEPTEEAQKAATKIADDLQRMITARQARQGGT